MILFFLFLTNCQKKTNHSDDSSKKTFSDVVSTPNTTPSVSIIGSEQKWSDLDDPSEDGWETEGGRAQDGARPSHATGGWH